MSTQFAHHIKSLLFVVFISTTSIFSFAQNPSTKQKAVTSKAQLSDSALLDLVQKQTFKYFWDFAHPVSGMARERSNTDAGYGHETIAVGGTGFGVMSVIVAAERGWITRDTAAKFLRKMINFLVKAN
jgi:hypothetical protein